MRFSTSSGAASSYVVAITAIGKSILGNKSTAKLRTDTIPRAIIASTIMMTPTGLLTDNETNLTVISLPLQLRLYCRLIGSLDHLQLLGHLFLTLLQLLLCLIGFLSGRQLLFWLYYLKR